MATERGRIPAVIGVALALLAPLAARAADAGQGKDGLAPVAVAFVHTLAKGDYQAAEADFTGQMKQALPSAELRHAWRQLLSQFGSFQGTGITRASVQSGYTTVVVRTDFKSRALGIAVSFDSAHKIAGVHFVPPP